MIIRDALVPNNLISQFGRCASRNESNLELRIEIHGESVQKCACEREQLLFCCIDSLLLEYHKEGHVNQSRGTNCSIFDRSYCRLPAAAVRVRNQFSCLFFSLLVQLLVLSARFRSSLVIRVKRILCLIEPFCT
jgi:hypothetical protein